ncbi:Bax inhibitor-1 family protein [Motiliproteus sp.]|uniref:Bax inhibitor-1 family protein n=1 Tax=Motiliproteus sp. TaxID=1898955 RepID=UPI003BA8D258
MNMTDTTVARSEQSILATNKLIRNTYLLLAMTLVFSAVMAAVSMVINPPSIVSMVCLIGSIVITWFVLPRVQNSAAALPVTFLFTGMLGFALGPILNAYLGLANGGELIMTAMGITAITFLGLSGYVLTTRKDFSFMGGFLAAGMMVVLLSIVAMLVLPFFGIDVSAMSLALSAVIVLLMCGIILYDTSNIVNGVYTNYVMAAAGLYLAIFNLFINLLQLLGVMGGDD